MEKIPQNQPEKIEEESENEENKMEAIVVETNSDATFTSTEPSQLPDPECNLPDYIKKCFRGHDQGVVSLAVHPLQKDLLVTGGMDDRLLFWSVGEERILGEMNLEETVNHVAFSSDGKFLGICVMGGKFVVFEMISRDGDSSQKDSKILESQETLALNAEAFKVTQLD